MTPWRLLPITFVNIYIYLYPYKYSHNVHTHSPASRNGIAVAVMLAIPKEVSSSMGGLSRRFPLPLLCTIALLATAQFHSRSCDHRLSSYGVASKQQCRSLLPLRYRGDGIGLLQ